jgi:TetR/AcrR family transcriptional regulator, cholesterol catabolism regulator
MATRSTPRRDPEVLSAAARVFHARGYADASVQHVADELGILKGSLYHYISSKEELLYRLLDGTHEDVSRILDEVSAEEGLAPLDRLRLYVRRQVAYSLANLERVAVYHHDLERLGDERRQDIVGRRRVHEAFVAGLIADAQTDGDVSGEEDARVLARLVFGTMILTYDWFRAGRDDPEQVADSCAEFAIRGVTEGGD